MDFILPHLSIKGVGSLTMVNSVWKEMCDDNEIWKILYMRTIRAKILDTSTHIGNRGTRDIRGEMQSDKNPLYYRIHPVTQCLVENPGITITPVARPRELLPSWWCYSSHDLIRTHHCLKHPSNSDFVKTLKTWKEVRTDGINNDEFPDFYRQNTYTTWITKDCYQYLSYIESEWLNYNKENGLSTVNLCQCSDHYEFNTLGLPDGCRNYKSFKSMVLKKEKTKAVKQVTKSTKIFRFRLNEYELAIRNLEKKKKEMLKAKDTDERMSKLCTNLDNVPGVKKIKKPVIGIAYPPPNRSHE